MIGNLFAGLRVNPGVIDPPASTPPAPAPPVPSQMLADQLEAALRDLIGGFPEAGPPLDRGPGRPPRLPARMLWLGFLLCVLRGFHAQRAIWLLVSRYGVWGHVPIPLTAQAIYQRLARASTVALRALFLRVTARVLARAQPLQDVPYATFATEIVALDHSTLDPALRKLKMLRGVPPGDPGLIKGRLATLFDLRRQTYLRVELEEDHTRNVKFQVEPLLDDLKPKTLLLFDLGYFGFQWFDLLTDRQLYFVSRVRRGTTWVVKQVLHETTRNLVSLRESLIYLGAGRKDRAAHPLRLMEVTFRNRTYCYITNVLDAQLLPAAHVVKLYARRWDIEQSFNLLKTHLQLYIVWSGRQNVVWMQVYATLIIAQLVLAFRSELAARTGAALREVSLPMLLQCVPELVRAGRDPMQELIQHGRQMGVIRPFRGIEYEVPVPRPEEYSYPERLPPSRKPRYGSRAAELRRPAVVALAGAEASKAAPAGGRQPASQWAPRARRAGAR